MFLGQEQWKPMQEIKHSDHRVTLHGSQTFLQPQISPSMGVMVAADPHTLLVILLWLPQNVSSGFSLRIPPQNPSSNLPSGSPHQIPPQNLLSESTLKIPQNPIAGGAAQPPEGMARASPWLSPPTSQLPAHNPHNLSPGSPLGSLFKISPQDPCSESLLRVTP